VDNIIIKPIASEISMQSNHIKPSDVISVLKRYINVDGLDIVMDLQKSQGAYIVDSRHNKIYLDLFSFVASNPVGLNHPDMNNPEFIEYIGKIALNKPSNSDIYYVEYAEFVKYFFDTAVPSWFKYSFFIEGGALAVENALKAAFDWKVRKNFQKGYKTEIGHKVIHFREAFHGRSGYTLSLTNTDPNKTDYFPKFSWPRITNPKIKFPLNEQNLNDVIEKEKLAISEIKQAIHENKDDIACIIIEPIQGEGGDNHFRKEFFEELRNICDENDLLLIFDEVQTGVGMTGKWWAHEHFVKPDIISFGKKTQVCGILAGEKLDEVEYNVFRTASRINSTWGGNTVDMIRFRKYLEIIKSENLINNAAIVGEHLLNKLNELQSKYPEILSNARGRGLFCAVDLPDTETRNIALNKIFENGVIILGSGTKSLRFRPALNITINQIDEAIEVIEKVIREL
jgi:L-lysine 6-transaminase